MKKENATFYAFKGWSLSRKYYATGRGHLSEEAFAPRPGVALAVILAHNDGKWPGLSGPGDSYFRFVVADDNVDHGWPLMFDPIKEAVYDDKTRGE